MKHFEIYIFGQVQDVNFRFETKRQAEALGLVGFCRNEPDGSVYIEIEGQQESLDKFLSWCQKGPFWAKVEKVEIQTKEVKGYQDFFIRR